MNNIEHCMHQIDPIFNYPLNKLQSRESVVSVHVETYLLAGDADYRQPQFIDVTVYLE